jgi:hypothetical protein
MGQVKPRPENIIQTPGKPQIPILLIAVPNKGDASPQQPVGGTYTQPKQNFTTSLTDSWKPTRLRPRCRLSRPSMLEQLEGGDHVIDRNGRIF